MVLLLDATSLNLPEPPVASAAAPDSGPAASASASASLFALSARPSPSRSKRAAPAASPCCHMCGASAAVHCAADNADLCQACDHTVHSANRLVSRHVRSPICAHDHSYSHPQPEPKRACTSPADKSHPAVEASAQPPAGREEVVQLLQSWAAALAAPAMQQELALHILRRVLQRLACAGRSLPPSDVRATLAAALWLASKADAQGGPDVAPSAGAMAAAACLPEPALLRAEAIITELLQWNAL